MVEQSQLVIHWNDGRNSSDGCHPASENQRKYALVTMCIGVGQGYATIERA